MESIEQKLQNLQKQAEQKKKVIKLKPGNSTFSINIPANVESKIRHLCARIHDIEWSGVLFYKVKGSFETNDFEATCLDICVMDIGTSGYTVFKDNCDIVTYRVQHPELLEEGVYEGLIHSHNTMATFFSGTDTDTLGKEGDDVNHFLSLIVNNAGTYTARITRKIKKKVKTETKIKTCESAYYNTYDNKKIDLYKDNITETETIAECDDEVVEWFDLKINKEEVDSFRELNERLDFIESSKKKTYISTAYTPKKTTHEDLFTTKKEEVNKGSYPTFSGYGYQGTLFGDEYDYDPYWELKRMEREKNEKQKEENKKKEEDKYESDDDLSLADFERVPEEITMGLVCQLVSGNIMLKKSDMTYANLIKWLNNLDKNYEERFGCLDFKDTIEQIKFWVSAFIETLIMYGVDGEYEKSIIEKYDFDPTTDSIDVEMSSLYANEMLSFLDDTKYNEGVVSNIIMEELTNYIA